MSRPSLEVADIIRRHGEDFLAIYGESISADQKRLLDTLVACRTAALGGHVDQCDQCDHVVVSYNSCRNRHCPKCQGGAIAEWLEARRADLLPTDYYHVVFTLLAELADLALQNKKVMYDILFRAASQTLLQIAADPKHLGVQLGFLAVLHTWGQTLHHHPHLHCVVPGGGLTADRSSWVACRDGFLLPVRVLSSLFRGKFLALLQRAFAAGELHFHGSLASLANPANFDALLARVRSKNWVVYAKPPFGGPEQVLKYLARYTHRVAISNSRLVGLQDGQVSFRWKDYANHDRHREMTLSAVEFIRRFLLHQLPSGFVRIRYYGFLANSTRANSLATIRSLLEAGVPSPDSLVEPAETGSSLQRDAQAHLCPACGEGRMHLLCRLRPFETFTPLPPLRPSAPDT
jgi:hypothetical protein